MSEKRLSEVNILMLTAGLILGLITNNTRIYFVAGLGLTIALLSRYAELILDIFVQVLTIQKDTLELLRDLPKVLKKKGGDK